MGLVEHFKCNRLCIWLTSQRNILLGNCNTMVRQICVTKKSVVPPTELPTQCGIQLIVYHLDDKLIKIYIRSQANSNYNSNHYATKKNHLQVTYFCNKKHVGSIIKHTNFEADEPNFHMAGTSPEDSLSL